MPPTRGVFQGEAGGKLIVSVVVSPSDILPPERDLVPEPISDEDIVAPARGREHVQ